MIISSLLLCYYVRVCVHVKSCDVLQVPAPRVLSIHLSSRSRRAGNTYAPGFIICFGQTIYSEGGLKGSSNVRQVLAYHYVCPRRSAASVRAYASALLWCVCIIYTMATWHDVTWRDVTWMIRKHPLSRVFQRRATLVWTRAGYSWTKHFGRWSDLKICHHAG